MTMDEEILIQTKSANSAEQSLNSVVDNWPFPINPGCDFHVRNAILQAVARIEAEGHGQDKAKIAEAEHNLTLILHEMTREARNNLWNELHEPTFFNALSKLCPIWPFC